LLLHLLLFDYTPSPKASESAYVTSSSDDEKEVHSEIILNFNMMKKDPRLHFGIPADYLYVLDEIAVELNIRTWYV
jgi:hypothetical protein